LASYDRQKWRSNRSVENSAIKEEAKNGSSKKEAENGVAKNEPKNRTQNYKLTSSV
jgi:hypothetical protein